MEKKDDNNNPITSSSINIEPDDIKKDLLSAEDPERFK